MNRVVVTASRLIASNTFMTFAWYAHLRDLAHKPWIIAALANWGIALCEYLIQVPANRIGFATLSRAQLKIIQEIITLAVFVLIALIFTSGVVVELPLVRALSGGSGVLYFSGAWKP
jgi:uncharacterized protein (DUF486 family)